MRDLTALLPTIGLFVLGVFLLSLGVQQLRRRVHLPPTRPVARRWLIYVGAGDLLLGAGLSAGAAYHLSTLISE